jgi:hypothetical protein
LHSERRAEASTLSRSDQFFDWLAVGVFRLHFSAHEFARVCANLVHTAALDKMLNMARCRFLRAMSFRFFPKTMSYFPKKL